MALGAGGGLAALWSGLPARAAGNLPQGGNSRGGATLEESTVVYPSEASLGMLSGVEITAHLVRPQGETALPGVVIMHDDAGLNDHMRAAAGRIAAAGYNVIVPDMLSRFGGTDMFDSREKMASALAELRESDAMNDITSTFNFLKSKAGTGRARTAIAGFGWGADWALMFAAMPDVAASVLFYGGSTPEPGLIERVQAPLLGLFAGEDPVHAANLPRLTEALRRAARPHEFEVYPDVRPGFDDPANAERHDVAAAADAWKRVIDHLDRHLKTA